MLGAWAWIFAGFDSARATIEPQALPSTSSSSTPSKTGKSWTMGNARSAVAGDGSVVLVLGDSTGNDEGEWVDLWAENELGTTAALWRFDSEDGYTREGGDTRVWSGSQPGAKATYPAQHWSDIWSAKTPDLVIFNFGHNYPTPTRAVEDLEALRQRVAKRAPSAPILVMLQNPQENDANEEARLGIAAWAKDQGLPTIDIAGAFAKSGIPYDELRRDRVHPSAEGSKIWADAVGAALR